MSEEKMTNCPKCQKPILNGGLFTSPAKFTIRCPWCQATLQINIQPKIVTEVIKLGNGDVAPPPETQKTQPAQTATSGIDDHSAVPSVQSTDFQGSPPPAFELARGQGFKLVLFPESPKHEP